MAYIECVTLGDYNNLDYLNLVASNIRKGVTISIKDPAGNVLKSVTGTYEVNTFTNLVAGNIKNGIAVTIKDSNGSTVKSVTGTYSADTKHTVYASKSMSGDSDTVSIYVDGAAKTSKSGSIYSSYSTSSISV